MGTALQPPLRKLAGDTCVEVVLGSLPAGGYAYYFGVVNTFSAFFEISIAMQGIDFPGVVLKENIKKQNFNFSFYVPPACAGQEITIEFRLLSSGSIHLSLTAFPQLIGEQSLSASQTWATEEMINNLFVGNDDKRERLMDAYRPVDIYMRLFKEIQAQNQYKTLSSLAQSAPVFYELIDLEEAKKQLEYVVYHKFFNSNKGGVFKKFFRGLNRSIFIAFYKMLTRSESRKNAIAKLYRNYININYISERK